MRNMGPGNRGSSYGDGYGSGSVVEERLLLMEARRTGQTPEQVRQRVLMTNPVSGRNEFSELMRDEIKIATRKQAPSPEPAKPRGNGWAPERPITGERPGQKVFDRMMDVQDALDQRAECQRRQIPEPPWVSQRIGPIAPEAPLRRI